MVQFRVEEGTEVYCMAIVRKARQIISVQLSGPSWTKNFSSLKFVLMT